MNYTTLTKTQKRCIDAFVKLRPELATASTISRQEVEAMFNTLYEARATGGEKIGYPMWLVKGTSVSRGNYVFPAPNATAQTVQDSIEEKSQEDKEFFAELEEYGILEAV